MGSSGFGRISPKSAPPSCEGHNHSPAEIFGSQPAHSEHANNADANNDGRKRELVTPFEASQGNSDVFESKRTLSSLTICVPVLQRVPAAQGVRVAFRGEEAR